MLDFRTFSLEDALEMFYVQFDKFIKDKAPAPYYSMHEPKWIDAWREDKRRRLRYAIRDITDCQKQMREFR